MLDVQHGLLSVKGFKMVCNTTHGGCICHVQTQSAKVIMQVYLSLLNGTAEELGGVFHKVLVQWAIKGNVDGGGGLFPPPCPACLLPQRRHTACASNKSTAVRKSNAHGTARMSKIKHELHDGMPSVCCHAASESASSNNFLHCKGRSTKASLL